MSKLMLERNRHAIRVPVRAIFSRSDGIVAWQACIDETTPDIEHHEVHCSHAGMGSSAEVSGCCQGSSDSSDGLETSAELFCRAVLAGKALGLTKSFFLFRVSRLD